MIALSIMFAIMLLYVMYDWVPVSVEAVPCTKDFEYECVCVVLDEAEDRPLA